MSMSACGRVSTASCTSTLIVRVRALYIAQAPWARRDTHQKRSQKQTNLGMIRVRLSSIASEKAATICTAQHCSFNYQNQQYCLLFPKLCVLQNHTC
jgi:hypothetical protein